MYNYNKLKKSPHGHLSNHSIMSHHPQSDQQANGTLSTLLLSGKSLRIGLKFFGPGFFVPAINPSLRLSEAAIQEDTRSQQLSLSLSLSLSLGHRRQLPGLVPLFSSRMVSMTTPQARSIGLPLMNLINLKGIPILQQLHLEEQLLRTSSHNWCIVNDGTNDPAIVMGVSGKPAELLEIDLVLRDQIPVIRRFTGGGTVTVDQNTLFVTFICNKDAVPGLQPYPRPIMSWSSLVYSKVFEGLADFQLRENDYVFGNRKFGGNAQSISKNRWIHHTSFLWDYDVRNMAYLKHPKRVPEYRLARDHLEFICCMKDYIPRSVFLEKTVEALGSQFSVRLERSDAIEATSSAKFVPSTRLLTRQELEEAAAFDSQAERNLSQPLSL